VPAGSGACSVADAPDRVAPTESWGYTPRVIANAATQAVGLGSEYSRYDALELGRMIQAREVSPLELVESVIESIERLNPVLNSVVCRLDDDARRAAQGPLPKGPLSGVPMLLKDLLSPYAGKPFTSGSRLYANYIPDTDAELVRRYKAAGLIITGKTNTPEFGILPVTEPELFGACRNPWNVDRTPGGSSGGAAASVAAGIVPVAHGGDGGGSIRIPAACCGLFGLKPTRGRNPCGPDASEHWLGFAVEHVLTRSVRDSAALLDVSSGPEPTSPYWAPPNNRPFLDEVGVPPGRLKIAFTTEPHLPGRVHADCVAAVQDAARLCESLGHTVVEAGPKINGEEFAFHFFLIICASVAGGIRAFEHFAKRSAQPEELELSTRLAGLLGAQLGAGDTIAAMAALQAAARDVMRFYGEYDVLLTPVLGAPPLPLGALQPRGAELIAQQTVARLKLGPALKFRRIIEATVSRVFEFVPFSPIANVTGQPSMSVPLFWNNQGLPIGTMFTGRFGDEATLLRLAAQLEAARPWQNRRPPVRIGQ
jgi:amidase